VRFSGKRVLLTGAASGVGKATAALFAAEGADLVALDVTEGPGITVCDLTDSDRVRSLVTDAGPFDVVLNIAGIVRLDHVADVTLETWQRHLDVNLTAPFVVSQAALAGLCERKGNIVNVASVAGLRGQAYSAAYCASKAGVVMLTKSMALELARLLDGVAVLAHQPGVHGGAALAVAGDDRCAAVVGEVRVPPVLQGREDRREVPAHVREPVLQADPRAGLLVGPGLEHAGLDEGLEPVAEHGRGRTGRGLDVGEAPDAEGDLPDDEQRPALADDRQAAGDGAGTSHVLSMDNEVSHV
jgi:meso-butanediol dehydrogenase/(S,S)-butanediol dehydrogenase/diacetyl reductase